MPEKCVICGGNQRKENKVAGSYSPEGVLYDCLQCGCFLLTHNASDDFEGERFKAKDKIILSICLRNQWEDRDREFSSSPLSLNDLRLFLDQYHPRKPLDKLNHALLVLEALSHKVGEYVIVDYENDFPRFHCADEEELLSVMRFLADDDLIRPEFDVLAASKLRITTRGYEQLWELRGLRMDSRQCFVAMWFAPTMDEIYKSTIKPAIEYVEEGESEPRFEAVKIDNVEHLNDINDEIIAQIRRSRFLVCDLTGYRGGVYFEAGFAYGLGLDVVYTCRKDWVEESQLKDKKGKIVAELFDDNKNVINVKKEGVHFDLAHRNRIEWEEDNLEAFGIALRNRIRAAIV